MSQLMTGAEVKAAYAAGRRDFRGADLGGADLAGAVLPGIQLGPQWRGVVMRGSIGAVIGSAACILMGATSFWCAEMLVGKTSNELGTGVCVVFVIAILLLYGLLLKKGATAVAVASAVASAVAGAGVGAVAVASAVTSAVTSAVAGAPSKTLKFVFGLSFTGASERAAALSLAVAVAGAGAVTVTGAVALAIAFASTGSFIISYSLSSSITLSLTLSLTSSLIYSLFFQHEYSKSICVVNYVANAFQLYIAWILHHRAQRGDPQHEWLRRLTLFFLSLGSTPFAKVDLTGADLTGAQLRGADLRGAVLRRTRFHGAHDLDWARTSPGPLRSVPTLHLLSSGRGTGRDYSGLDLSELDLSYCDLSRANLSGCDLRGTALPPTAQLTGVTMKRARIDALTYQGSHATPDDLADWHDRGVEIIALEAFPLAAQERIAGEREGLTLYFSARLRGLDEFLIRGVIFGVLGTDTTCHFESTVKDPLAVVRLFDAPRTDLERVAEALHQRVWEQAREQTSGELAALRSFLGPVDLRAGLSDLVQRLQRMTLRTEDAPAAPATTALALREGATPAKGGATTRWDWQRPTGPSGGQLALKTPLRVLLLFCVADRALADGCPWP